MKSLYAAACFLAAIAACDDGTPHTVTLTAYPVRVLADGLDTSTLIATVRDVDGQPLANTHVTLQVTGVDNVAGAISGTTDELGVFVTSLRSSAGEVKTVTASTGAKSATQDVTFTPLPPCLGIPRIGTVPDLDAVPFAFGDFDEDGMSDFVGGLDVGGPYLVVIALGHGDGTFKSATSVVASGNYTADALVAADFDKDGHLDIAFANQFEPLIRLMLGNGDGTMQAAVELPLSGTSGTPQSLAVGDFDGDGNRDLVAATASFADQTRRTEVLFGKGDGTFDAYQTLGSFTIDESVSLVAGDFDGDQRTDFAAWQIGDTAVNTLFGNANRTFTSATATSTYPLFYSSVVAANVDADGQTDLLVATRDPSSNQMELAVVRGRTDRTLPAVRSSWSYEYGYAAADLDGDGVVDFVRASDYLRGNGDGTFSQGPRTDSRVDGAMHVVDLDGNGSLDVVGGYHVLLNDDGILRSLAKYSDGGHLWAVGDFDNDGYVDVVEGYPVALARRGNGDGTFDAGVPVTTGELLIGGGAKLGDFDRDGFVDIVTRSEGVAAVQLGNGDGTFAEPTAGMPLPGDYWSVVDLDRDGKPDVASGTSVLLGNGDGTFGALIVSDTGYLPDFRGTYADLDEDGNLDLVAPSTPSDPTRSVVYVGNGDGTFQYPVDLEIGGDAYDALLGDVDLDGHIDVVSARDSGVVVHRGNGDTTFAPPIYSYEVSNQPRFLVDINRDGKPDLVSWNGTISLGDGAGMFGSSIAYLEGGFPVDVDADGMIDLINGSHYARQAGCFVH